MVLAIQLPLNALQNALASWSVDTLEKALAGDDILAFNGLPQYLRKELLEQFHKFAREFAREECVALLEDGLTDATSILNEIHQRWSVLMSYWYKKALDDALATAKKAQEKSKNVGALASASKTTAPPKKKQRLEPPGGGHEYMNTLGRVNCGTCRNCRDMPRYGGPGTRKKPCFFKGKKLPDATDTIETKKKRTRETERPVYSYGFNWDGADLMTELGLGPHD